MTYAEQYEATLDTLHSPELVRMVKSITHPAIMAAFIGTLEDYYCTTHGLDLAFMHKAIGETMEELDRWR